MFMPPTFFGRSPRFELGFQERRPEQLDHIRSRSCSSEKWSRTHCTVSRISWIVHLPEREQGLEIPIEPEHGERDIGNGQPEAGRSGPGLSQIA